MNRIIAYRSKHPRCRYCKYCYLLKIPENFGHCIHKCKLKDKYIKFFNYNFCGCFCDYFKLGDIEND